MGPLRSFCLPRPRSGAQSLKKRPLKLQELKEASSSQKKKKRKQVRLATWSSAYEASWRPYGGWIAAHLG
ncbi:hypothetical protein ES288_A06G059700v1 [Gossypium darwinii]|uniref:Uncharacterized protein n=1 Tax=Gossypium darwinii TaxID=34276 RepID=A0A5D2G2F4_GOSDA|nr:hypothetical protein ES288_A06G059700v1 [Gossypium darwinii]